MPLSHLRVRSVPLLLLGLLLSTALPEALRADVRIVDEGDAHLRLRYEADGVSWMESAGYCLLGIPLQGEVLVEIVDAVEGALLELTPDEAEELAADLILRGPVHLGEPGYMRNQKVASLSFPPRLTPNGRLQTYDRVVVDIYFTDSGDAGPRRGVDRWGEELYRGGLLNYHQATGWRKPRRFPVARIAAQEDVQRVRIRLREEGIYRITGDDLAALGVDLSQVDPARLRLLYGGGETLSESQSQAGNVVRLVEQPIVVESGADGRFDGADYLLFAAEPVSHWERGSSSYRFAANRYTLDNVYWLETDPSISGLRAPLRSGEPVADALLIDSYRARLHQESENQVLAQPYGIKSGYDWYWEEFDGDSRSYPVQVQGAAPGSVDIRLGFFGFTAGEHQFNVLWNNRVVGRNLKFSGNQRRDLRAQARAGVEEGLNHLGLAHRGGNRTRFDWYELEFSRRLLAEEGELIFDAPLYDGLGEFHCDGFVGETPRIFEVSEGLAEIVDFAFDAGTGSVLFQDRRGIRPRRYVIAGPARWRQPLQMELDSPALLRSPSNGADYVVIAYHDFIPAAERLAAWRGRDDRFGPPLVPMVVDVRDVYDEFSGGLLDPAAIRNFLHYAAENWSPPPMFVTLFGDGTYDYKNNSGISPINWIPAYQLGESTFDEWYVRVQGGDVLPDMAIGRLAVQTSAAAERVVDKLIAYDDHPEPGPWRSRALMVADDLINPSDRETPESYFLTGVETIARFILPRDLDQVKLYIARFPLEGQTKPRANSEFIRLFNEGALLLTYVGHGNPDVLAHEQMFVLSRDASKIRNGGRLPFMYTAASQIGVFDDPARTSMPEVLLNMPEGGVIGMISATRVGFHASNMILARAFHDRLFRGRSKHVPVGQALMTAKVAVDGTAGDHGVVSMRRYSLIGDPATRLARPRYRVEIQVGDTLRALQQVRVEGRVLTADGSDAADYQGRALVEAFDSATETELEGLSFLQPGSPMFRGRVAVTDGRFEATFRVPRDITYKGRRGRISTHVSSADQPAAIGFVDNIRLAGARDYAGSDQTGPQISIGFRGQPDFKSGGLIPGSPVLRATITDTSGINITGETGHHIMLSVDGVQTTVTHAFVNDGGDYRTGTLEHRMSTLEPGNYLVGLKAWDNFNNSATAEVEVRVGASADVVMSDLLFYPNPLDHTGAGHFTFNLFNPASSLMIQVFSLTGRLVDQVEAEPQPGYNQVEWRAPAGLANGTYVYRVRVVSEEQGRRSVSADETSVLQVMR